MGINYDKLGLKIGIEIHQQINTRKLFCNCESQMIKGEPDYIIKRKLRVSKGELGKEDIAAKYEKRKEKDFIYNCYNKSCCLVELDEEPPHDVNKEALNIVLQISKLLNADIVDKIEVMRKMVIDGSNTSGFQRTMLVALGGHIDVDNKKIGIGAINLEEDSAQVIERKEGYDVYNLSRLGIPLVEISTKPDIKSPQEAKVVAEKMGLILRSTNVKRGIGTIRQDINLSITNGARVEIKGFQDIKVMPKTIENEVKRQVGLINLMNILKNKNKEKGIISDVTDVTDMLKKTNVKFIKKSIENNLHAVASKVNGFSGLLGYELYKDYRFGTELAGYAKAFGFGGIIHSDENLEKYGFTEKEIKEIKEKLGCGNDDAFIIVVGNKDKSIFLLNEILNNRIEKAFYEVPKEVRKANNDGTTTFLRPLPGAARLYPETDVPLIVPPRDIEVPITIDEKIKKNIELGLSKDLAKLIAKEKQEMFERFVDKFRNIKPSFIAEVVIPKIKEIKREGLDIEKIKEKDIEKMFLYLNEGKITKDSIDIILRNIAQGKIRYADYFVLSDDELEREIKNIVEKNKGVGFNTLIGKVMSKLKGKAEGKKIVEITKRLIDSI